MLLARELTKQACGAIATNVGSKSSSGLGTLAINVAVAREAQPGDLKPRFAG